MPTPRYPVVLFDLDHTLFDFEASKKLAFAEVLEAHDHDSNDDVVAQFAEVEKPLWAGLESGDLTLDTLNYARWSGLVDAAGIAADPASLAAGYLAGLGRHGGLFPGAREVLDALHRRCTLGLITNGYAEVQRARLDNFDLGRYFDVMVISSEIGVAKPDPRFFDSAMSQLQGRSDLVKEQILVIGDSLTSDMAGAVGYGLPACWYNPHGAPRPDHLDIDHTVTTLHETLDIIL